MEVEKRETNKLARLVRVIASQFSSEYIVDVSSRPVRLKEASDLIRLDMWPLSLTHTQLLLLWQDTITDWGDLGRLGHEKKRNQTIIFSQVNLLDH